MRRFAIAAAGAVGLAAACTLTSPLGKYQAEKDRPDAPVTVSPSDVMTAPIPDDGGSWHLYSFDWGTMTWDPPKLVSDVWTGPNAPPSRGIKTAVQLVDFQRLIIFSDDGYVYVRSDGNQWLPPVKFAEAWQPLTTPPAAAWHVPHAFTRTINPDTPVVEGITLVDPPNASSFQYAADGGIRFDGTKPIPPDDGGPDPNLETIWSFEVLDLQNADPGYHWRNFTLYVDGTLFEFRADFSYSQVRATDSPIWKDKAGAPPPASLMAAWFDEQTKTAYFAGR